LLASGSAGKESGANLVETIRSLVDRRAFVAGGALAVFAPALRLPPSDVAAAETLAIQPAVLLISGWSVQDDTNLDPVWMKVGHGWKTAWR
jgi:hypothetical protein